VSAETSAADWRETLPLRTRAALGVAALAGGASRRLGRGDGQVIGGRLALALDPQAIARLATGREVALVSATNGKTTTTRMLHAAWSSAGPVATNLSGANLPTGVVTALGADRSPRAVLEVDELVLPRVLPALRPRVALLLNLSRDQLDRFNEVRRIAARWREAFATSEGLTLIANADDPLVTYAAAEYPDVVWVAVGQPWLTDASSCPRCRESISADEHGWRCAGCGFSRPEPAWRLDGEDAVGPDGRRHRLDLHLPGRANRANATTVLAAAGVLGITPERALPPLRAVEEVAGRYLRIHRGEQELRLYLAKNPAGWLEALDMLATPPRPAVVAINARTADGRDPSWLWDAPFERLAGRRVVVAGDRSADLSVRLRYAGVDHELVDDPVEALRRLHPHSCDLVANYTAFQDVRAALRRSGEIAGAPG